MGKKLAKMGCPSDLKTSEWMRIKHFFSEEKREPTQRSSSTSNT
jgi:hypothetical protein